MERFWEPWRPQVGQRTRIHLSGECQRAWSCCDGKAKVVGHPEVTDGSTGTVARCPAYPDCAFPDHPYLVRFDRAVLCLHGETKVAAHFAAVELEPLEDQETTG